MLTDVQLETKARLEDIVGKPAISEDPGATRLEPWLTVRPADTAQVQAIVALANETGTPLVPVSSGEPHLHGGSTPSVPGAVRVDLRRLDRVLWIDRRNRLALIEPGVTYEQLVPALAAKGLRIAMPLLPRRGKSVLASLLEREPPLVPRWHWNPMEPLRSLEVVWGDGERLLTGSGTFRGESEEDWKRGRVPVTGGGPGQLDFFRLLSGAQGSMGIATCASVKCEPASDVQQLRFIPADRLEDLIDTAYRLLRLRFGDETFLVDAACLAQLLARDPDERAGLAASLPPWSLVVGIGGGSILGEEKVTARTADISEIAAEAGLDAVADVPGCAGADLLELLGAPSPEPYWKHGGETAARDIFFLSTLDQAPRYVALVEEENAALAEPVEGIGVYLQPIHMGASCHIEFVLPFRSADGRAAAAVDRLHASASRALLERGAYFSRPYGSWAELVFEADPPTRDLTLTMKGIFDPANVMNPGKLCFPGAQPQEDDPHGIG
jgi:FAD/FMN-containing dehydrogenase